MARHEMMYDGRRLPPRNSRGEFRRRRSGDRGMDYGCGEMRHGDGRVIRSYPMVDRRGGDYGEYDMRGRDMRYDHPEGMRDGHYQHGRQSGYEPVEFMGYCQGYYGSPDRGEYRGGRDYGYDMRGRRDYGYDYGYDYGDYGETLSEEELKKWEHKLMGELDEREKQMFHKDAIMQKIRAMGLKMEGFSEKELYVNTLANYTDHKKTIGQNPDMAIRLAYDDFCDEDSEYRGAEWLAVYYDTFVEAKD